MSEDDLPFYGPANPIHRSLKATNGADTPNLLYDASQPFYIDDGSQLGIYDIGTQNPYGDGVINVIDVVGIVAMVSNENHILWQNETKILQLSSYSIVDGTPLAEEDKIINVVDIVAVVANLLGNWE